MLEELLSSDDGDIRESQLAPGNISPKPLKDNPHND